MRPLNVHSNKFILIRSTQGKSARNVRTHELTVNTGHGIPKRFQARFREMRLKGKRTKLSGYGLNLDAPAECTRHRSSEIVIRPGERMSADCEIAYGTPTVLSLQDGPGEPAALNTELFNLGASPVAHTRAPAFVLPPS